jgi:S-adenosylmethionine hydrolase
VGSPRRALAARARGQFWVGPDNGLFHLVLAGQSEAEIVEIKNQAFSLPQVSATFHGRDVLAPVAAHLSLGVNLSRLGPRITAPVLLDFPAPEYGREAARGEVIYVDRFGNPW